MASVLIWQPILSRCYLFFIRLYYSRCFIFSFNSYEYFLLCCLISVRQKTKVKSNPEPLGTKRRKAAGKATQKPAIKKPAKPSTNHREEPTQPVKKKTNKDSAKESSDSESDPIRLIKNLKVRTVVRNIPDPEEVQESTDEVPDHKRPSVEDSPVQPESHKITAGL